jgi:hypothetical protein
MDVEPMPPIDPAFAVPGTLPGRSKRSRVAFSWALACGVVAELMTAGILIVSVLMAGYAGEAAADPVASDGVETLVCLGAFLLAAVSLTFLYRFPLAGSVGLAVAAVVPAPLMLLLEGDSAGFEFLAVWLPGALFLVAAIWGFVYRSQGVAERGGRTRA